MGVFPRVGPLTFLHRGLPHARGGVSGMIGTRYRVPVSSPRPWGCFRCAQIRDNSDDVFPTPVGVFLARIFDAEELKSLPHARGGVSKKMRH